MSINKLKVEEKSGWIWSTTIHKDDQSLLFFSKTSHVPPTEHQTPNCLWSYVFILLHDLFFNTKRASISTDSLLMVLVYGREAPLYCSALFMDRSKSRPHSSHSNSDLVQVPFLIKIYDDFCSMLIIYQRGK